MGPRVIRVFHGELELVFMPVVCPTILGAAVGEHALQGNAVLLISAAVIGVLRSYSLAKPVLA